MVNKNSKNICRTCLIENIDMKSVFMVDNILDQTRMLCDIMMICASIQVHQGDGLPEQICKSCAEEINRSFIFRKLCEKSEITLKDNLKECLSTNHIKPSEEEPYYHQEEVSGIVMEELTIKQECHTETNEESVDINEFTDLPDKSDSEEEAVSSSDIEEPTRITTLEYNCDNCDLEFKTKRELKSHQTSHKKVDKTKKPKERKRKGLPTTCDICNKSFKHYSNMVRHRVIHTGEKPFLCNVCGKGFQQLTYLKIHTYIHTGEKPYKCDMCEKSFGAPSSLMGHKRIHTGEKPHVCQICGKKFSQSGYLTAHIRFHTGEKPVECEICHLRFVQRNRLKIHMRTHSGEKPYPCNICGRSFKIKTYLKTHMRTHTGEKPFQCEICEKSFTQKGKLTIHLKKHKNK